MTKYDINNIDDIVSYIMDENNISDVSLQKYYSLKWFLLALQNDSFTFQKPSTWSDPFEDFISKLTNNSKGAFVNGLNITDDIYAMSTINKRSECDGMWSNFAKNNGVLIHTSPRKIIKSLVSFFLSNGCCKNRKVYLNGYDTFRTFAENIKIEKITYATDKKIADFFKNLTVNSLIPSDYNSIRFEALSMKRIEYDYESEYRVFILPSRLNVVEKRFLNVGYFKQTISKITLSPNASSPRVKRLNLLLTNKYGINAKIIEQSELYNINVFKKKYGLN